MVFEPPGRFCSVTNLRLAHGHRSSMINSGAHQTTYQFLPLWLLKQPSQTKRCQHLQIPEIYTLNPNGAPCFDWNVGLVSEGSRLKIEDKQVPGTWHICVCSQMTLIDFNWTGPSMGEFKAQHKEKTTSKHKTYIRNKLEMGVLTTTKKTSTNKSIKDIFSTFNEIFVSRHFENYLPEWFVHQPSTPSSTMEPFQGSKHR